MVKSLLGQNDPDRGTFSRILTEGLRPRTWFVSQNRHGGGAKRAKKSGCARISGKNSTKTGLVARRSACKSGRNCGAENASADEAVAIVGQGCGFLKGSGDYSGQSAKSDARWTWTARASGLTRCRKAQVPGGKACGAPASQAWRAC